MAQAQLFNKVSLSTFGQVIILLQLGQFAVNHLTKPLEEQKDSITEELLGIDNNAEQLLKEVPQTMKIVRDPVTNEVTDFIPPAAPMLPKPDPRDTHLPQFQSTETKLWKAYLQQKLQDFKLNRNIWIDGSEMKQLLIHLFGANEQDFETLENACDNMNHDPALAFRKVAYARLGLDLEDGTARRLERAPYVLSAKEGFKRHDSGMYRFFGDVQDWVVQNTAFQAIVKFKSFMMYNVKTEPRPGCDPKAMFNQNFFFARTISTPKTTGEPAAEGVHQDGVQFTMTMLLKSRNIDFDKQAAATSKLFSLEQPIGVSFQDANETNVIAKVQHKKFLDTLLFVDNEVSHAVSPCKLVDPQNVGHRDMMVVFSRRMAQKNSKFISAGFDSTKSHPKLPAAFALKSKILTDMYPQTVFEMPINNSKQY